MLIGAIDLGGTHIKYGIYDHNGEEILLQQTPTEAKRGGKYIVDKLTSISHELMGKENISGIAISSAGQIDANRGEVIFATDNIPHFTGFNLKKVISESTGLKVSVENDVNCAALGEHWKGVAKQSNHFFCLTLGTGIGGAVFLDGKLYHGANFGAGEIGHMTLFPNGKMCTCGSKGCFEQYASSSALQELINMNLDDHVSLPEFFDRVKSGDREFKQILGNWIDNLTTGLRSIVHMLNPELVVIGGGISAQGQFLEQEIEQSLMEKIMPNYRTHLQIKCARNGNNANLLGAVKHFLNDN